MGRIFLTGYMGSGKSTLGRALAKASGMGFVDLDGFIEERTHRTVKEIFESWGEDGFRMMERKLLHEVAEFDDVVVACGGGTPCFFDNMDFMNSHGITVFLDVRMVRLVERLRTARAGRPLIAGKSHDELLNFVLAGLEKRLPFYRKAHLRIDGGKLEDASQIEETVRELMEMLERYTAERVNISERVNIGKWRK